MWNAWTSVNGACCYPFSVVGDLGERVNGPLPVDASIPGSLAFVDLVFLVWAVCERP